MAAKVRSETITRTLKALYGLVVIVRRYNRDHLVTGELTEDTPKEILVIGPQITVGIDIGDIEGVYAKHDAVPEITLKHPQDEDAE